jgi:hypothetical protein
MGLFVGRELVLNFDFIFLRIIKESSKQSDKIKLCMYRRTLLYAIDRNCKIWLAYNEFAFKKTKDDYKIEDIINKDK